MWWKGVWVPWQLSMPNQRHDLVCDIDKRGRKPQFWPLWPNRVLGVEPFAEPERFKRPSPARSVGPIRVGI